jgi:hypothetical protein
MTPAAKQPFLVIRIGGGRVMGVHPSPAVVDALVTAGLIKKQSAQSWATEPEYSIPVLLIPDNANKTGILPDLTAMGQRPALIESEAQLIRDVLQLDPSLRGGHILDAVEELPRDKWQKLVTEWRAKDFSKQVATAAVQSNMVHVPVAGKAPAEDPKPAPPVPVKSVVVRE